MGETHPGKGQEETQANAGRSSLADASAQFVAGQAAMMTIMTAFSVNIATQMAGLMMGAVSNALEKQPEIPADIKATTDNVVPLKVVRKGGAPKTADDLKAISGIGPKLEKMLNSMGVMTFADIAKWDDETLRGIDEKLGLGNRAVRDGWVKQAKALLEG